MLESFSFGTDYLAYMYLTLKQREALKTRIVALQKQHA